MTSSGIYALVSKSKKKSCSWFIAFPARIRQKSSQANPISGWASSISLKRLRRSPARIQTSPVRIQTRSVLFTDEAHHEELNQDGLDLEEQLQINKWSFPKRSSNVSLSPETLEMLIYENVDMDGYLTYRDESSNKLCKIRLDDDIIMTVNFLFDHKGDNHSNHVKRKRVSRYGYIENVIFITKYKSSQIYKKFSNQFGGKIKWLCATPNQIVNINKRKIHRRKICKQSIPIPELI